MFNNKKIDLENCPDLLTTKELAEFLRISERTAYNMVRCGKIKRITLGTRVYRIPKKEVIAYINGECA